MYRKKSRKYISHKNGNSKSTDNKKLSLSLKENILLFRSIFTDNETLIVREFQNKSLESARCCILYFDGMIDTKIINEHIIEPVLACDLTKEMNGSNLLIEMKNKIIASNEVTDESDTDKIVSSVLYGDTVFLLEGYSSALIINTKGWQTRQITEPESTKVIRGPREGFTESISTNLSMVRRKITSPDLKFKFRKVGVRTNTKICICYIEGLALNSIIKELEERLNKINIDGIIDSGYIQELIKDSPYSPFATVGISERPDVIAAKLLEGRIALFVDGSPITLTVPYIIVENFQSNEDYYVSYIIGSMNRMLRCFTAIISVIIPALFLSVVNFHQEMLPTPLLLSISAARQDVPLPTSISLIMMLLIFDVLREAGIRMPSPVGQAVNIIGSIVLGQAAVEARLVSAPVLIITALTGIMTLLNMIVIDAAIIFRTFLLLGAAVLGFYGFFFCSLIVVLHLMSIRSFGVPYMMSITRFRKKAGNDTFIRAPWWTMTKRPEIISKKNPVRQSSDNSRGN